MPTTTFNSVFNRRVKIDFVRLCSKPRANRDFQISSLSRGNVFSINHILYITYHRQIVLFRFLFLFFFAGVCGNNIVFWSTRSRIIFYPAIFDDNRFKSNEPYGIASRSRYYYFPFFFFTPFNFHTVIRYSFTSSSLSYVYITRRFYYHEPQITTSRRVPERILFRGVFLTRMFYIDRVYSRSFVYLQQTRTFGFSTSR